MGVAGWIAFAHVVFKTPLSAGRDPSPADLVISITGPLGAVAGAIAGGVIFKRMKPLTIGIIIAILALLCGWFAWAFRIGV